MSLHESIERRRKSEPTAPECAASPTTLPTLVVRTWKGERWALPWSRLDHAKLFEAEGQQRLILTFTTHCVTVTGENLHLLWDGVAAFTVGSLRELPAEYRLKPVDDAAFIRRIEIQVRPEGG